MEILQTLREKLLIEINSAEWARRMTSDDEGCVKMNSFICGLQRAMDILEEEMQKDKNKCQ